MEEIMTATSSEPVIQEPREDSTIKMRLLGGSRRHADRGQCKPGLEAVLLPELQASLRCSAPSVGQQRCPISLNTREG